MTTSQRREPARILPLQSPAGLHALLADIVAAAERTGRGRGGSPVTSTLDVAAGLAVPGDPRMLRRLLTPLVDAAFATSAGRDRRRPGRCEVVVTAVVVSDGVEIEVADSGDAVEPIAVAADLGVLAARAGGTFAVARCPEGGRAVTLRLPLRSASSRAA
jgi:signal transduction histidine kinase